MRALPKLWLPLGLALMLAAPGMMAADVDGSPRRQIYAPYIAGAAGDAAVLCSYGGGQPGIGGECFDIWNWEAAVQVRVLDATGPVGVRLGFLDYIGREVAYLEHCPGDGPVPVPAGAKVLQVWVNGPYHNARDCLLPGVGASDGVLDVRFFGP